MKKNRFLWALLLLVSLGAAAQDNIHFVAGASPPEGGNHKKKDVMEQKKGQNIIRQKNRNGPTF